ncbi:hypothetical protein B0H17DRAFT_1201198 [Mycena rosella]|uniref:Uncharacterized protein n=1 Tax=Mycena rosella TaxID=1033263 RepID=A0AAD7DHG3_MYCRO|nr:hypothetical protein B0H17DRAFT_1201198 [Mycena rosella]
MSARSLATIPQEVHHRLLISLSDFDDLAAAVLCARPLHRAFAANRRKVLSSVGRNFLGALFTDALLLARGQEKRDRVGNMKGFSPGTVRLLVQNAEMVGELQGVMFGLLSEGAVNIGSKLSLTRFADAPPVVIPSETESQRFKAAAYRFCVYCLLQLEDDRLAFLNRYTAIQVLELANFVNALYILVHVIRGRAHESDDDWNFASSVMSTGPHAILDLWAMKRTGEWGFKAVLKAAGRGSGDEHFMNEWCDVLAAAGVNDSVRRLGSAILDEENRKFAETLTREAAAVELQPQTGGEGRATPMVKATAKAKGKAKLKDESDPFD